MGYGRGLGAASLQPPTDSINQKKNLTKKTLANLLKAHWAFCVCYSFLILAGTIEIYIVISFLHMPLMPQSSMMDREGS